MRIRNPFRLEALETRTLLAAGLAGDPGTNVAWQSAVVADIGVTLRVETTAQDHTLILQGTGSGTMLTLNTDQLSPDIDRIAVESVDWIRLTGSRSFETVELSHVHYADLGATGISLVLYASQVDRLQVNATDLTAVISGGSTLIQSERFNGALLLTDAADLRLSSSHVVPNLSIVNLSPQNTVSLDFSVGKLSLVNFIAPVRLLPFDSSLLNTPAAPRPPDPVTSAAPVVVTTPPPTAAGDALPPVAPAQTPEIPGDGSFPLTLTPPAVSVSPVVDKGSPAAVFPGFAASGTSGADSALPALPPSAPASAAPEASSSSAPPQTGEITAEVGEISTALPDDLSAQLPAKLTSLPSPLNPSLSSELAHLLTQALLAAQTNLLNSTETKLPLGTVATGETATAPGVSPAANFTERHPSDEAGGSAKRAHAEKGGGVAPLAASTWERSVPAHAAGEFSSSTGANSPNEGSGDGLFRRALPLGDADETSSLGHGKAVSTLRISRRGASGNELAQTDGSEQLMLFQLPPALRRQGLWGVDPGEQAVAPSPSEKIGGWVHTLAGVSTKLAADWTERLWPYSRPVQAAELKAYLVEQFLAEVTPGERSLLLMDASRLRPVAPFALILKPPAPTTKTFRRWMARSAGESPQPMTPEAERYHWLLELALQGDLLGFEGALRQLMGTYRLSAWACLFSPAFSAGGQPLLISHKAVCTDSPLLRQAVAHGVHTLVDAVRGDWQEAMLGLGRSIAPPDSGPTQIAQVMRQRQTVLTLFLFQARGLPPLDPVELDAIAGVGQDIERCYRQLAARSEGEFMEGLLRLIGGLHQEGLCLLDRRRRVVFENRQFREHMLLWQSGGEDAARQFSLPRQTAIPPEWQQACDERFATAMNTVVPSGNLSMAVTQGPVIRLELPLSRTETLEGALRVLGFRSDLGVRHYQLLSSRLLCSTRGRPGPGGVSADALTSLAAECVFSRRETDLGRLLLEGCSANEIATRLNISLPTVKSHTQTLFRKAQVHSRLEFVARCFGPAGSSARGASRRSTASAKR